MSCNSSAMAGLSVEASARKSAQDGHTSLVQGVHLARNTIRSSRWLLTGLREPGQYVSDGALLGGATTMETGATPMARN